MSSALTYDSSSLYKPQSLHGISQETKNRYQDVLMSAQTAVRERLQANEYAFIEALDDSEYIKECETAAQKISWAKKCVVVGIGGSDLGARMLLHAFGWKAREKVKFFGDSTDPEQLHRLLTELNLEETVFYIVSKSGETVETLVSYLFLKQFAQEKTAKWQDHFVFCTGATGALKEEASSEDIFTIDVPEGVGGRFSVFTAVGLVPALVAGIPIHELLEGAKRSSRSDELLSIAESIATDHFLLSQQDFSAVVLMPYSIQLDEFARWFRQLWAESLGKDGKGMLAIQSRGPADQHSQVQFYVEGTLLQSLLFVRIEERETDFTLPQLIQPRVEFLSGHSLGDILNIEQESIEYALSSVGRPFATLSVQKLTPEALGMLCVVFELSVVFLAEMLGVNAFNQPAVELGKQYVLRTLKK